MDGPDLEYEVLELTGSRRFGQVSAKEMMVMLQELLAAHSEVPAETEDAVWRAYEEGLLSRREVEILLGPIGVKQFPPGAHRVKRGAPHPEQSFDDPHAEKRRGM